MSDGIAPEPYDASAPVHLQMTDWTCSICSTWWGLTSLGYEVDKAALVADMSPWPVDPAVGLLDASGAGLVQYIQEHYAVPAANIAYATWENVLALAGTYPVLLGGRGWYHWCGCRGINADGTLALANSAPGWKGVGQAMSRAQFEGLGPFSMVVMPYEEDDVSSAEVEALINQLGYIQGDCMDAMQSALDSMVNTHLATDQEGFGAAAQSGQAVINTVRGVGH
jgi:hypothetical protein